MTASRDKALRFWDTTSGKLMCVLEGHIEELTDCALSADGQLALSASWDKTLRLWRTATGELLRVFEGHTEAVTTCALSSDGKRALSVALDGKLFAWDTAEGKSLLISDDCVVDDSFVNRGLCALSADGRLALASWRIDSADNMWLYTTSGQMLDPFQGHSDTVTSCALNADGSLALSASLDGTLRLWSVASGKEIARWTHGIPIKACTLSADGHMVAACDEAGNVHFLDVMVHTPS